jgi:two-component system, NtrC family, sensor kinase
MAAEVLRKPALQRVGAGKPARRKACMRPKADVNYYKSLTRNMMVIVIVVSFTPMILVSGVILESFQDAYTRRVNAHIEELVLKHKQNIDGFLRERLNNIVYLANSCSLEQLRDSEFLQEKLASLQSAHGAVFEDIGLVNSDGLQVAYAGPFQLAKALYSQADWFNKAITNHQFISDVFLGIRGLPHFIVTVRKSWHGENWVLRATIDFVAFNNLVENLRIGQTGFAFILNRNGEFQTRPLFEVIPDRGYIPELLAKGNLPRGIPMLREGVDHFGRKNIYASLFLKDGDWLLLFQQNKADAFSSFYRTLKIAAVIFLLGGVGIVSMAFILSRRMTARIQRADREKDMMSRQVIETGKLASVGELAAGIAHEINNPVAIMVEEAGWIEDLLAEVEFKESENFAEFSRALRQINTQGKRCKEITHKLLSFARKTDPSVQDVQVNGLIEDVIGLYAQRARYDNVVLRQDLQKSLPSIQASPTELQQIFLNLINNSLDAMEKSGGTIDIATHQEGSEVIIEVTDDGPGIPKANLGRIFDPFFTTKPVGKGTGLGLSICYGIIRKMGWDIEVQSAVDAGTTFRIRIPVPPENGSPNPAPRGESEKE